MPITTAENELAERRYVTVVIRLLLDHRGKLLRGEAVGVEAADGAAAPSARFDRWTGLVRAVQTCLPRAAPGPGNGPPTSPPRAG